MHRLISLLPASLGVAALLSTFGFGAYPAAPRSGAGLQKGCTYNGTSYSHGAVVCQAGFKYECNDGNWDALNQACSQQSTGCSSVISKSTQNFLLAERITARVKQDSVSPGGALVTVSNLSTGQTATDGTGPLNATAFGCAIAIYRAAMKVGLHPIQNGASVELDKNSSITAYGFLFE